MSTLTFKHHPTPSFNNLMSDFLFDFPSLYRDNNAPGVSQSVPVNISEAEGGYKLDVVVPGFQKEDFTIHLEKNLLTVSAEKKVGEEMNEKHIRKEYVFKPFKRTFTIDEKIDAEKIEAKYESGVLTLTLAKKIDVKAPSKQITIQ